MSVSDVGDGDCALENPNTQLINTINHLATVLNLEYFESQLLFENPDAAYEIQRSLGDHEIDDEFRKAVRFYLQLILNGINEVSITDALTSYLPPALQSQVAIFKPYLKMKAAVEMENDPNIGVVKAYYRAFNDLIHLGLDFAGLVPVVGEVFDVVNGTLYAVEGDWSNAGLSTISAIPVWGTIPAAAKIIVSGSTVLMVKKANGLWTWTRDSYAFRKTLGLVPGDGLIAHHILPLGRETHQLIQRAANAGFDLNKGVNGIPLNPAIHGYSHSIYSEKVMIAMDNVYNSNMTPQQAVTALQNLVGRIKVEIINNPNTPINNLNF